MEPELIAVVVAPDGTAATPSGAVSIDEIATLDAASAPRWVVWSQETALRLTAAGVRLTRCWDLVAAHRLLRGGWASAPDRIWAAHAGLPSSVIPQVRAPDLFHQPGPGGPLNEDGYLDPEWAAGAWADSAERRRVWADLALQVAVTQQERLTAIEPAARTLATARSESTAELLCAELTLDGLPVDLAAAEAIIESFVGPRPHNETEAVRLRVERDDLVLRHAPADARFDLRSPGQVKSLLRRIGIEVPDTRAWRLERLRGEHPLVDALLAWRKAERVATTYGYAWLDEYVSDGRLRGAWSGSDGAAGRMTASAGLHNMPADMRGAVVADPGHVFVRADLGQIEPRVLAAVSGDAALATATAADDMYVPVAQQLGVDRATAKVAMLGAMYGQTTGHGAQALRGLQRNYPVAMEHLEAADRAAQVGNDLRTYGGRLVRMSTANANDVSDRELRTHAAARGRYGRNAMVQGAAAELFKVWALTVRARVASSGGRIVLCLHDELLVHAPEAEGERVARLLDDALQEAAHRWAPRAPVRFLADVSVVRCWADAKG